MKIKLHALQTLMKTINYENCPREHAHIHGAGISHTAYLGPLLFASCIDVKYDPAKGQWARSAGAQFEFTLRERA
jgi:hypothetical protein